MAEFFLPFFSQKKRNIFKKFFFSKKRSADLIFSIHFLIFALPALAMQGPEVDPSLDELRMRFVRETGARSLGTQVFPLEVSGDILSIHGILEDTAPLYKPSIPMQTSTLLLRAPEPGYLDRQGLYQGYRLLFGEGYIVPSLLVQFKETQTNTSWMMEVLPNVQSLSNLCDLKAHYETYSMGVHCLGLLFFPYQSMTSDSFTVLSNGRTSLVQHALSSQDRLESKEPIPTHPLLLDMKPVPLSESLKTHLKKRKVTHFISHWLYALFQAEERVQALGYPERVEIHEEIFYALSTLLQKMVGITCQSSSLTYGEIQTLTQRTAPFSSLPSLSSPSDSVKGLKALSLVVLNNLFFKSEQRDWTEVFEVMGETFADYGSYFKHQAHRLRNLALLKDALHKNRKPSVLTLMLNGGLQAKDLGEILHEVVQLSGQRLDTSRTLEWIKALAEAGVPLEHKLEDKTALDIAFEQHKHVLIESLIENGAGADVKPHLIMDYISSLGDKRESFNKCLDLLEFRNHRLRWSLTLEALLPLHTGQESEESLRIRTTDGERVLSPVYISKLWNKGKVNPKHFISFTELDDSDQTQYGRRVVGQITQGRYTLYVKQFPELPGIEEAVGIFMRQLLGYGAPNTLLSNINGTAYLFSEGIPGRPLHDYLTGKTEVSWNHVSAHLDPEALSGMMLLAMLTNPEDGKPDNYIVQECPNGTYRIISIDNDHSFVPSATTVQGKRKINVKSILFALDQMKQELHSTLKRKFLYHNPQAVLEEWIKTLQKQLEQYDSLFTPKEVISHFKDHQSFLGIALHPSIVVELYKNLSSLQHLVESEEHLTHMDTLRRFHPPIYLRYQAGHDALPTESPLERFKHVDGKEYGISKKKGFKTLSTGQDLLSTNMMITTQKELVDYVKQQRGREIRLDTALTTLKEVAEQDSHLLVQQALTQAGIKIPFEHMTDPQRESFLKELDWSKLSIPQQQTLLDEISKVSWGDPKRNLSPWRGVLTFRNCAGFTESTFLTKGFDQKMNWENIQEVRLTVDGTGGKEAYMRAAKVLQSTHVPLKIELRDLTLTDEELDLITSQGNIKKLILIDCQGMEDHVLRQKAPSLIWKGWMKLKERTQSKIKKTLLEGLGKLDLGDHDLGAEGARALAAVLKDTQVHTLNLSSDSIGVAGVRALASVLKDTQVHTLDLSGNNCSDEGARALAAVLKDTHVHTLYLSSNNCGAEGVRALAAALKDTQVHTLDFSGNNCGAEGVRMLAAVLKNTHVHTLDLSGNNCGAEGVRMLAAVLKDTHVHTLHLSHNYIGDEGTRVLVAVLRDTKVCMLDLEYNNIGVKGARALATILKDTLVDTLYLGSNIIENEGARALAAILRDTKLHTLDLRHNNIGDEGAQALVSVLEDTQVCTLNLEKDDIGDEKSQALVSVLKEIKRHKLDLGRNKIGYELQKQINIILLENKAKYGPLPSDDLEEGEDQEKPSKVDLLKFYFSQEEDLETLLSEVGLKGTSTQKAFANEIERVRYLLNQNDPNTYPSILKILEWSLSLKIKEKKKGFVLQEDVFGFEEETFTDILPSASDPQEKIFLLDALSQVYPRALLSLAKAYYQQGDINSTLEVLTQALKHQIPGTLKKIEDFYREDGHTEYALLMAENFLQGYMSLLDLSQGETWLRQALSKEPINPEILTKLAQVLLEKGGLEDQKTFEEIVSLLSQAKAQGYVEALSLDLMIQELQQNLKIKDVPLSHPDQRYTAREQRLLRALHQSQFGKPHFETQDLSEEHRKALEEISNRHTQAREHLLATLELEEKDLEKASPLDKTAIEAQILTLKQNLSQLQEKQHEEIKRLLFPKGIKSSSLLKEFYQTLSVSLRQQFSLLDAVEGGLAARKEKFSERKLKDAAAYAVGQFGNLVISNMPVPASGILALVVGKITETGLNKLTEMIQSKITARYDAQADKERQGVREVTQNYENNTLVANGLAALSTYRLQNLIPVLTQKSLKELAIRISASYLSYLQDQHRLTNPQNLTQLMALGFYQTKDMSVGEALDKARGKHGFKKSDGSLMDYAQVFSPLIETSDGAQYQVESRNTKKRIEGEAFPQIVPLIEKEFLENERLQGTQIKLQEKRLPQLPPFQVEILRQQDDTDYARKALTFVQSL